MFRRRRTVRCRANAWTTILDTPFAQLPVTWTLHLDAAGAPVDGAYEERKTRWVFPTDPVRGPLSARMTFERGYWNTFYSVRFRPTVDVDVTIE
jgi:hypothetical protein